MMNSNDYQNAFKALESLNEDNINLSRANVEEIRQIIDDDADDDIVSVYDLDADDEKDLDEDNVGKIVLQCPACNTVVLKGAEDLDIPENCEGSDCLVQLEDCCCPICLSEQGYKIIGKVAPYEEVEVEITSKNDEDEEEAQEEELSDEDDDELEEVSDNESEDASDDENEKDDLKEAVVEKAKIIGKKVPMHESEVPVFQKRKAEANNCCKDPNCKYCKDETVLFDGKECNNNPANLENEALISEADVKFDADDKAIDKMNAILASDLQKESLKEGLNDIQLDTDNEHISIHSEAKNSGDEMIAPLDFQSANEIADAQHDQEDMSFLDEVEPKEAGEVENEAPAEDEANDSEETDADIDEFDTDSFDKLGESFLQKKYSNIKSYKTESVIDDGNNLICEGLITFTSGKVGRTQFVIEGNSLDKYGNCSMLVENAQITPGKKAMTLSGKLADKKFVAESFIER